MNTELAAIHVYPESGPEHDCNRALACWCHPDYELCIDGVVVVHNVQH